jgi:hypothetical protein
LRLGDEPLQRHSISVARRDQQSGQVIHDVSFAACRRVHAVTYVSFFPPGAGNLSHPTDD